MIAIIDYQSGNLASVTNALKRIDAEFFISHDEKEIKKADKIIFPGVGHAGEAMKNLQKLRLINVLQNWKKPFLGICLGMQLMCKFSEEGSVECLSIVDENVKNFKNQIKANLKIPHMGWNNVKILKDNLLFKNINNNEYFYFVHSYFVSNSKNAIGLTNYDLDFCSTIQYKNFYGVQFHPEKSGVVGLRVLENFVNL